ncbi:uncharacterized protein LOC113279739 [Papaver somniferum]|uniref:uncharacterized protein LOC113279739 n=1 Tax=Papaver somniferum TaxID=3469 RepID=UPI000E702873|nr:uncharacterized protein LOC113279739 [Papaver somniferum]
MKAVARDHHINNSETIVHAEAAAADSAVAEHIFPTSSAPKNIPFNTLPTLSQLKASMDIEIAKKKKEVWKAKKKAHSFENLSEFPSNTATHDPKRNKPHPNENNQPHNISELANTKRFKDLTEDTNEQIGNTPLLMANGLGTRDAKRHLNDMLNNLNPDIIFLSENKQYQDKLKKTLHYIGVNNYWFVNPGGESGTAGGLALIWKSNISLDIMGFSLNHINAIISPANIPSWLFTGYYGSPYDTQKKLNFWKMIDKTAATNKLPWMVICYFNFILHDTEKFNTHPIDAPEASLFNNKILDMDLVDIGFNGCPFTWSNKRRVML